MDVRVITSFFKRVKWMHLIELFIDLFFNLDSINYYITSFFKRVKWVNLIELFID